MEAALSGSIHLYDLRHITVTLLLGRDTYSGLVQELLGYVSTSVTLAYSSTYRPGWTIRPPR